MVTIQEYREVVKNNVPYYTGIENVNPAFIGNVWNSDNWNSFELLEFRDIMDTLYYDTKPLREELYVIENSENCVDCIAVFGNTVCINETYYLSLTTVRGKIINHYFCEVYKNRGRTEKLLRNNKPITGEEFMELLDLLSQIYPDKVSLK